MPPRTTLRPSVREIAGGGGRDKPPGTQGCASSPGGDGLTRVALGYPAERAALGGGGKYYPPTNSRTNGQRGMSEAAIEISQREDSCELLKFSLKGHV